MLPKQMFALQLPETAASVSSSLESREESQQIAHYLLSAINANYLTELLCRFFSMKIKLFRLRSDVNSPGLYILRAAARIHQRHSLPYPG
jgi:hypothetical protein